MNSVLIILSFLFLTAPGIFLLIASTVYQSWWEKILKEMNNNWIKSNGNTMSQILGSVFTAIGLILMIVGFSSKSKHRKIYDLRKRNKVVIELKENKPGRKIRKTKEGKKYILKYQKGKRKYRRVYL